MISGKDRKRAKVANSRFIKVQVSDAALSTEGLLDVESFISARIFEIEQLDKSIIKSRDSGSQRAFQKVPRFLRRRTASHNVKRVPRRLRNRALQEMLSDSGALDAQKNRRKRNIKKNILDRYSMMIQLGKMARKLKREENIDVKNIEKDPYFLHNVDAIGVNSLVDPPKLNLKNPKFSKRQLNKNWLPTHIWHAKRAHMVSHPSEISWFFAIPESPTQKCYRATHRLSSQTGTIAFDTSYISTIILTGSFNFLTQVIKKIGGKFPVGKRFTSGKKHWEGLLYRNEEYANTKQFIDKQKKVTNLLGPGLIYWKRFNSLDNSENFLNLNSENITSVMIRIHPAIFQSIWDILMTFKSENKIQSDFTIFDCRRSIGSIDLCGPESIKSITSILHNFYKNDQISDENKIKNKSFQKLWNELLKLHNPKCLPKGAAINLNVHDPRLFNSNKLVNKNNNDDFSNILLNWPDIFSENPTIFDHEVRKNSYIKQASKKGIDKRQQEAGPGKSIEILSSDPCIPVTLLKHETGFCSLILPWEWVVFFWHKLMHLKNVSFGGLKEQHQIFFESSMPYFPHDFIGTEASVKQAIFLRSQKYEKWKAKPTNKRRHYEEVVLNKEEKGEIGDPFSNDWEFILSKFDTSEKLNDKPSNNELQGNTNKRLKKDFTPWLITNWDSVDSKEFKNAEGKNAAFLLIKLKLIGKGAPCEGARIYMIPRNEKNKWNKVQMSKNLNDTEESKDYCCPNSSHLIGYVSTGNFNLSYGQPTGIGCISWAKLHENGLLNDRLCLLRNVGQTQARLAKWEPINL